MATISISDFESLCRICMQRLTTKNGKNLFNTTYQSFTLVELFDMCTTSTASEDDGLPANLCGECASKLISSYEFCVLTSISEKTFREILSEEALSDNIDCTIHESEALNVKTIENDTIIKCEPITQLNETTLQKPKRRKFIRRKFECIYCKRILDNFNYLLKHIQLHERRSAVVEKPVNVSSIGESEAKPNENKNAIGYQCEYCPEVICLFRILSIQKQLLMIIYIHRCM